MTLIYSTYIDLLFVRFIFNILFFMVLYYWQLGFSVQYFILFIYDLLFGDSHFICIYVFAFNHVYLLYWNYKFILFAIMDGFEFIYGQSFIIITITAHLAAVFNRFNLSWLHSFSSLFEQCQCIYKIPLIIYHYFFNLLCLLLYILC